MIVAIPWLALRLVPALLLFPWQLKWVVALSFYAMKGPRVAIANGQPSILVFFLMIVTLLLRQRHWLWAGIALGVALSKYSIALPVVIFLLLEKRFRLLFVAFFVQVISLIAMGMLEGGNIGETVRVLWNIIVKFSKTAEGIHLGFLLPDQPILVGALVALGTIITLAAVIISWRRGWLPADWVAVNSLLMIWTLLMAYHRVYDIMLVFFFWVLCLYALTIWQLPRLQAQFLGIFWLVSVVIMCLPGESTLPFISPEQAEIFLFWSIQSVTLVIIAMWVVNLWLLGKTPRTDLQLQQGVESAPAR
jgi:hypothetical protein